MSKHYMKNGTKLIYPIIVLLLVLISPVIKSQTINKPNKIPDPSLEQLYHGDSIPELRWRAYGDIDKDGIQDLVLSSGLSEVSQNGVTFMIYFGDSSGNYQKYDSSFGSPNDLCFERLNNDIRMWSYWHISAGEGIVGCLNLTDTGLSSVGGINIFSGDGGTKMGKLNL